MALKRKARIYVLVFATLLAAGVEYYGKHHPPAAGQHLPPKAVPSAVTAAPAKPLPVRHWQLGNLNLTSCELPRRNSSATTAAWCTTFDVSEDPAQPSGRHIGLHLAILRSDASSPEPDIVVMLAGGPGEAATEAFSLTGAYQGVLKHHHVLLLDQRGTGSSNPLSCDETVKAAGANAPVSDVPSADTIRKVVGTCLAEVQKKADPRFYTTTVAVDDLERVRQALGAPLFDLYGGSYGTRMAQQYVMRHPEGVRSVILDSPAPNELILGEDFAASLDSALKRDFASCVATPDCKKAFGDPMVTLHKLRDELRANPHEVTIRDPRTFEPVTRKLTPALLAGLVRLFAYEPETAALLPLSIDAAMRGDAAPLLGQQRLLDADLAGDMNGGMSMSVICSEDADELHERPQDADTILGNMLIQSIKAQCDIWPHGAMPADFHKPLHTDKPVLILSGEGDPVTPPQYGKQIMQGLSNGRHLVLKGQGHGALTRGCVPKLVEQFFDNPNPKNLDARCLDRLGPTPALIQFNGAAP